MPRAYRKYALPMCQTLVALASSTAAATALSNTDNYLFLDSFESSDCSQPLTCAAPLSGKTCVAGQLRDAATAQPLRAEFNPGLACAWSGAAGGVCYLSVKAYDALQYSTNPAVAATLASGAVELDGCGRFRIPNLTPPGGSNYVAVVVTDRNAPFDPPPDHLPTATLVVVAADQKFDGITAAGTTLETAANWESNVGVDFASGGGNLLRYATGGSPTAGVTVHVGLPATATIFYFSDADAQRTTPTSSATSTGADGSALLAGAGGGFYSGTGGETGGCHWPSLYTQNIPGVIVYSEFACTP